MNEIEKQENNREKSMKPKADSLKSESSSQANKNKKAKQNKKLERKYKRERRYVLLMSEMKRYLH